MELQTVAREIYPGRIVNLFYWCGEFFPQEGYKSKYRIVLIEEGYGIIKNQESSQLITAPCLLCLSELDSVSLSDASGIKLKILYFEPTVYDESLTFEFMNTQRCLENYSYNVYYFRPFLIRKPDYIGAIRINPLTSRRLSQIMDAMNIELTAQKDGFWPCRSRSYFLELMLLVSSVYENNQSVENMVFSNISEDIRKVIQFFYLNYPEKITLKDLTAAFHTNKTTLNERFKRETGLSVMEYLSKLRIDIACSILRNTHLTIFEIMERVGFKDDSHFNRTFQKHMRCSPSAYRAKSAG